MEKLDLNKEILNVVRRSIQESIKTSLNGYGSPMLNMVKDVVNEHDVELRSIMREALSQVVASPEFRVSVKEAFGELPSQDRPIRLSDVLNAIMHTEHVVCIASNERFELFDKAKNEWVQQFKTWYLANDDLNAQDPETISFLYDMLK